MQFLEFKHHGAVYGVKIGYINILDLHIREGDEGWDDYYLG